MTVTDIALLTTSPGELKRRPDGARYHDGETIITHLNYALQPWGWDWAELDSGTDTETDEVYVLGQLVARFTVAGPDGSEQVVTCTKIERGWQKINRLRDGSAKAPGDDKKGAATDALKRCARLLGVGLDAWSKASHSAGSGQAASAPVAPQPRRQEQPHSTPDGRSGQAAPPPLDLSPAGRADLRAHYIDLLARAGDAGHRASWRSADPAGLSDIQLQKYTDLLVTYLERSGAA